MHCPAEIREQRSTWRPLLGASRRLQRPPDDRRHVSRRSVRSGHSARRPHRVPLAPVPGTRPMRDGPGLSTQAGGRGTRRHCCRHRRRSARRPRRRRAKGPRDTGPPVCSCRTRRARESRPIVGVHLHAEHLSAGGAAPGPWWEPTAGTLSRARVESSWSFCGAWMPAWPASFARHQDRWVLPSRRRRGGFDAGPPGAPRRIRRRCRDAPRGLGPWRVPRSPQRHRAGLAHADRGSAAR